MRRVPAGWKHPVEAIRPDGRPVFRALDGHRFSAIRSEYLREKAAWEAGEFPPYADEAQRAKPFEAWAGPEPDPADYMPEWLPACRTHVQMYETTTPGTPISPVLDSMEELARWLVANGSSIFADRKGTYEEWMRVCQGESLDFLGTIRGDAEEADVFTVSGVHPVCFAPELEVP